MKEVVHHFWDEKYSTFSLNVTTDIGNMTQSRDADPTHCRGWGRGEGERGECQDSRTLRDHGASLAPLILLLDTVSFLPKCLCKFPVLKIIDGT